MTHTTLDVPAAGTVAGRAVYPSLRDKHVLITGGGSGIGEAIVEAFVAQGAMVSFIDIAETESLELVERLTPGARHAPQYHPCNLCDLDQLNEVLARIEASGGAIELLVNNAANDDRHRVEEVTPAYWDERMAVNLRHLFFVAQTAAASMRKCGRGGAIVNLGSISWHLALPDLVLYQTAKAGIEGMTRALARDLGSDRIRVNTIIPGGVKTPRQDMLWHDPEEEARILQNQCIKARVMPADIAAMALFLCSEDAQMCTGHNYFVDAGWR